MAALGGRLFNEVARVYLSAISWFDALWIDPVIEDDGLLIEANGDWLYAGY